MQIDERARVLAFENNSTRPNTFRYCDEILMELVVEGKGLGLEQALSHQSLLYLFFLR